MSWIYPDRSNIYTCSLRFHFNASPLCLTFGVMPAIQSFPKQYCFLPKWSEVQPIGPAHIFSSKSSHLWTLSRPLWTIGNPSAQPCQIFRIQSSSYSIPVLPAILPKYSFVRHFYRPLLQSLLQDLSYYFSLPQRHSRASNTDHALLVLPSVPSLHLFRSQRSQITQCPLK